MFGIWHTLEGAEGWVKRPVMGRDPTTGLPKESIAVEIYSTEEAATRAMNLLINDTHSTFEVLPYIQEN
jgi:hypothetical protein